MAELSRDVAESVVGPGWAPLLMASSLAGRSYERWLSHHATLTRSSGDNTWNVGLTAEELDRLLVAFDAAEVPLSSLEMPPRWQQRLAPTFEAEKRWLVCQVRKRLLSQACDVAPPLEGRLDVADLVNAVRLQALFPEGLPIRATGEPVTEYPVRLAELVDGQLLSLPNVPLRLSSADVNEPASPNTAVLSPASAPPQESATTPDDPERPTAEHDSEGDDEWLTAQTDETGICRLSLQEAHGELRVEVAAAAVLGPLAEIAPFPDVQVTERPLSLSRNAVVRLRGKSGADVLQANFERTLTEMYGRVPASLSDDVGAHLARQWQEISDEHAALDEPTRTSIVQSTHGTVDYLLLLDGHSEFASQMGAGRTWYEAQGTVRVFEVWSGKLIGAWEEATTRAGIGDAAARDAAESALAVTLAEQLRSLSVR